MIVSLNEIEQTALKAARGGGVSWGEAEEIATAARWLALHRLDWASSLVPALELKRDATSAIFLSGQLCDVAALAVGVQLARVRDPMWLAAFAAAQARGSERSIAVRWPGTCMTIDAFGYLSAYDGSIAASIVDAVVVGFQAASAPVTPMPAPHAGGRAVDTALWVRLGRLEARTYVAASDQSRISGAGASVSDND